MKSTKIVSLNGVTATAEGSAVDVSDAKKIAVLLRRAAHTSGSSAFAVKGSLDPVGTASPAWFALNLLIDNVTNTNAQNPTRVAGKTLSSDTDAILFVDRNVHLEQIRVDVTETTDGTHSAWIIKQS